MSNLNIDIVLGVINIFAQLDKGTPRYHYLISSEWSVHFVYVKGIKFLLYSLSYRCQFVHRAFNLHKVSLQKHVVIEQHTYPGINYAKVCKFVIIPTSSNISSSSTSVSSWVIPLILLALDNNFERIEEESGDQ